MNPAVASPLALLRARLEEQEARGLTRRLVPVGPRCGREVSVGGRPCLLMASNDYLGLTDHPRLAEAARKASLTCGAGSGASRLVSGTLDAHQELEAAIAAFKHTERAVFLPTGYMANLAAITGLTTQGDLILSDALNHASIVDACRLSRAEVRIFPHADVAAARRLLDRDRPGLTLIVTDGVFSMDGDLAPLPGLLDLAREAGALLVIDDAHATGVYGETGRGSLEHFGLTPGPEVVQVGTFSKALGGLGGSVCGAAEVVDTLVNRARPLLYSTAPPPAQVAVARAALELVDAEPQRRQRLRDLAARLRAGLTAAGFRLASQEGPIVPVLVGGAHAALALAAALSERGVFAPAIRPPTVPEGSSRIRLTVTAGHTDRDIDTALAAMTAAAEEVDLWAGE